MQEFIAAKPSPSAVSLNSKAGLAVELFQLSVAEQALSGQLEQIICQDIIASGGVISFRRYMELALYYPGLGYYSNNRLKFGAAGDFITAPLVSRYFGYLLARQLHEIFNFGVAGNILEFGAGNGKLAVDILISMGDQLSNYFILELSADLRLLQQEMIERYAPEFSAKVSWLQELPIGFKGVMLANEVLDAQPCDLVEFQPGGLSGVGVAWTGAQFTFHKYPLSAEAARIAAELNLDFADYRSEIHVASMGFIRSLAHALEQGALLLIDYGCGASEYYHPQKTQGSLRGFYRQHVLADVLCYPGIIDITVSVNFSAIATTAIEAGLELIGYTTQAGFLMNCGLSSILQDLYQQLPANEYLQISNQINKLIAPNEMGDLFKVVGFSKNLEQDSWLGFAANDRSYTL